MAPAVRPVHVLTLSEPKRILFLRVRVDCSCGWNRLDVAPLGVVQAELVDALSGAGERHLRHAVDVLGEEADFEVHGT